MSSHHKYKLADTFETLCEIWNLKFTICNLQFKKREKHPWRSDKVTLLLKGFSRFLKPTNCTKLRKAPYYFSKDIFPYMTRSLEKIEKKCFEKMEYLSELVSAITCYNNFQINNRKFFFLNTSQGLTESFFNNINLAHFSANFIWSKKPFANTAFQQALHILAQQNFSAFKGFKTAEFSQAVRNQ